MNVVNYYELLGVPQNADAAAIKDAVRKTRKRFRQLEGAPDVNQRQMAETKMTQIAEAEKILLDATARQQYDRQLAQQTTQPEPRTQSQSSESTTSFLDDAKSYYRNGQLRNAAYASKEATRSEKDNPNAWYIRAQISLEMNDYSDADFSANQALKLEPNDARIYGVLGDVADRESRYAAAERYFNSAAKLEPDNYYWVGRVAWALSDQERHDEALSLIRSLYNKYPQEKYVKVAYINIALNDIEHAASHSREGSYCFTNKKQIEYARNRMQEIDNIGAPADMSDLLERVASHKALIDRAARRKCVPQSAKSYMSYVIGFLVAIVFISCFVHNSFLYSVICIALSVALVWVVFEETFPYQWKINQRAMGDEAKTGLQE